MQNKVNRKEFAEMCGTAAKPVSMNTINAAIRRGYIVVDKDGLVILTNAKTKKYLSKKLEEKVDTISSEKVLFDYRKKELEAAKLEEELRVARIRRMKMEGEVIPTDLAKSIFRTHFKNLKRTFMAAAEQMSVDMVKMLGGNNEQQAKAKEMLAITINKAAEDGIAMSEEDIKNIVQEYSEDGNRGRRKSA